MTNICNIWNVAANQMNEKIDSLKSSIQIVFALAWAKRFIIKSLT